MKSGSFFLFLLVSLLLLSSIVAAILVEIIIEYTVGGGLTVTIVNYPSCAVGSQDILINTRVNNTGVVNVTNVWLNLSWPAGWSVTDPNALNKSIGSLLIGQFGWNNMTYKTPSSHGTFTINALSNSTEGSYGIDSKTVVVYVLNDGYCDSACENSGNEPACAAAPSCGNGNCEAGETQSNCCSDCGCPSGQVCCNGACAVNCGGPTPCQFTDANSCRAGGCNWCNNACQQATCPVMNCSQYNSTSTCPSTNCLWCNGVCQNKTLQCFGNITQWSVNLGNLTIETYENVTVTKIVSIKNIGNVVLHEITVKVLDLQNEWYSFTPNSYSTLAPNETKTFSIAYSPTTNGTYNFRMNVTSREIFQMNNLVLAVYRNETQPTETPPNTFTEIWNNMNQYITNLGLPSYTLLLLPLLLIVIIILYIVYKIMQSRKSKPKQEIKSKKETESKPLQKPKEGKKSEPLEKTEEEEEQAEEPEE